MTNNAELKPPTWNKIPTLSDYGDDKHSECLKREAELLHVVREMEKAGNHLAEMAASYSVPIAAEQRIVSWEKALSLAREVKG